MKEGWEIKKLGNISDIKTGKSNAEDADTNGEYTFFGRSKKIKKSNRFLFDCETLIIPGEGSQFFPRYFSGKFDLHQRVYSISNFHDSANIRFIEYFLVFNHKHFENVAVGATVKSLRLRHFTEIEIPLPPLPEQQRIVSILDKCFSAIERSRNNAEQNLKNAKELFESYLQGVFEKKGDGWEEKTLGEVCDFSNGKAHEKIIDGDGKYILINSKFVSSEGQKFKRTTSMLSPLYKGDIVFVMSDVPNGKTLAKCFLVDKDDTYSLNQRICVIRSNNYDKRFLYYHLNRHRYLLSFNNGENQTNLRKNDILNTPLFLMPNEEQQTIVRQLDAIKIETQKMEAIYQKKIADLEELKKSVLQKAFAGELKVSELGSVGLKDDKIKMNT